MNKKYELIDASGNIFTLDDVIIFFEKDFFIKGKCPLDENEIWRRIKK